MDVKEIIKGVQMGGKVNTHHNILTQYHHVFWMGDLNYRLDFGDQGDAKTPDEPLFKEMCGIVNQVRTI
jgi:hypothetical protein